jgi:hypothetical protein
MNNYNRYEINPFIFSTKHYVLAEYANFYLPPIIYTGPLKTAHSLKEPETRATVNISKLQSAYNVKVPTIGEPIDQSATIPSLKSAYNIYEPGVSATVKLPSNPSFRLDIEAQAQINNNTVLKILDSTNNENHGVKITNDINKAQFLFDGVNDYILVLNDIFEADQDFTIQLKCTLSEPGDSQILIGSGEAPPQPSLLLYSNTNLGSAVDQIRVFAHTSEKLVGSDITVAGETLITLTRSSGTWKLYEDGSVVDTLLNDFDLIGNDLIIGGHLYLDDKFKGIIASVQVSGVARSDDWISLDNLSQTDDLLIYSEIQDIFFIITEFEASFTVGRQKRRNFKSVYSLRFKVFDYFSSLYDLYLDTVFNDEESSYALVIQSDVESFFELGGERRSDFESIYSLREAVFTLFESVHSLFANTVINEFESIYGNPIKEDYKAVFSRTMEQFSDFESVHSLREKVNNSFSANYSFFNSVNSDFESVYSSLISQDLQAEHYLLKQVKRENNIKYSLFTDAMINTEIIYTFRPNNNVFTRTRVFYNLKGQEFIWTTPTFILQVEEK